MPGEICPLLLAAREPSKTLMEQVLCRKNECTWFYQIEGKDQGIGLCAIYRIGSDLHQIVTLMRR